MPTWMCMSTRANAVRHLLYTRYSKFSVLQSRLFVSQFDWSDSALPTVSFATLRAALERELSVLEETYCINVLSGHFTSTKCSSDVTISLE